MLERQNQEHHELERMATQPANPAGHAVADAVHVHGEQSQYLLGFGVQKIARPEPEPLPVDGFAEAHRPVQSGLRAHPPGQRSAQRAEQPHDRAQNHQDHQCRRVRLKGRKLPIHRGEGTAPVAVSCMPGRGQQARILKNGVGQPFAEKLLERLVIFRGNRQPAAGFQEVGGQIDDE